MNKKITSSALAALMVAGSTSFTAFAAMTNGTVVIGTKAFDLNYANLATSAAEIGAAVNAGGTIYVKDFTGKWINNITGATVDASLIPAVTYKSATGVVTLFAAGDMDAVTTVAVSSVSAITTKKVEVKFNNVADSSKAQFAVKKGTSSIGVSAITWSADFKTATLELNTKISDGTYDVTVSGLSTVALTGSVIAENEKIGTVKILSDKAVLVSGAVTATVGYQMLNQYGEDITSSSLANESNLVVSTSAKTVSLDNKGTATITAVSTFKADDKVALTIVDKATTKSANSTLTIVSESKVADTIITGIYNADNKTLNEDTIASDFYLLFNATNQYGNAVTTVQALKDDLTIVVSNPAVVDVSEATISNAIEVGTDKKVGIKLDAKAKGDSTVTIISNSTGKSVSYKVTVAEGTKVDTVSMLSPEGTVAGGEEVLVPIEVTNNKGMAVTDANKMTGVAIKATQGNTNINTTVVVKAGKLYIKLTTEAVTVNNIGTLVLTATTPTNKIETKVITVKPDAKAVAITGLKSTVSTSIYKNLVKALDWKDFTFEDQYGRAYTKAENAGYTLTAVDATTTGTGGAVSIAGNKNNNTTGIEILGINKGSELVTFTLRDVVANKDVSSFDSNFTTVEQSQFTSYKVDAITPMLYTADTDYTQELVVYGVTASGQNVKLPASDYNVTVGTGLNFTTVGLTTILAANVATPALVDNLDSTTLIPVSADVNVKVVINATGDELSLKAPMSSELPKFATLETRTPDVNGSLEKGTLATALDLKLTAGAFDSSNLDPSLYVVDQYGVEATSVVGSTVTFADASTKNLSVTISNLVNEDKDVTSVPAITANGLSNASIAGLESGDTFTVKLVNGTAVSNVNIVVTP